MTADIKGFEDLGTNVLQKGICGACGGCLAFCSAGEFNALRADEDGTPVMVDESKCLHCGVCYLICPRVNVLDQELREKVGWKAPVGPCRKLVSAKAHCDKIRQAASDGGVVTALLTYALKNHLIQAAIVSRRVGPFSRVPMVARTTEDLIQAATPHFEESQPQHQHKTFGGFMVIMGQRYTTFSPGLWELRSLGMGDVHKIALVGTPCQILTIRKMQLLNVLPADRVVLTIGLFCMENFFFHAKVRRALEKSLSVELGQIDMLNLKDDVVVTTTNRETIHIPFDAMDEFVRPACFACTDFAGEYADISCGGVGSPDGYTTTVLRTSVGETLYNGAKDDGVVEELTFPNQDQRRNADTEMMAKIVAATRRKQVRAAKRMEV